MQRHDLGFCAVPVDKEYIFELPDQIDTAKWPLVLLVKHLGWSKEAAKSAMVSLLALPAALAPADFRKRPQSFESSPSFGAGGPREDVARPPQRLLRARFDAPIKFTLRPSDASPSVKNSSSPLKNGPQTPRFAASPSQ